MQPAQYPAQALYYIAVNSDVLQFLISKQLYYIWLSAWTLTARVKQLLPVDPERAYDHTACMQSCFSQS